MTPARFITVASLIAPLLVLTACGGSGQDRSETAQTSADAGTSASPAPGSAQAAADAPAAFAVCRSCHAVEPGRNGVGPSLFGIVGTKAGDVPGYNFSPALKGSGVTWDRQSLDTWLQGPMKMVPGTKMVIGVPDPKKRQDVIDYLESLK